MSGLKILEKALNIGIIIIVILICVTAYQLYLSKLGNHKQTQTVVRMINSEENQKKTPTAVNINDNEDIQFQGFVPVLMYHALGEEIGVNTVVHPEEFREQLTYLKNQGYTTISLYDLVQAVYQKHKLPEKPILITFDDGYLDNYTYAFPILKELQMKATIHVVTSQRGQKPGYREHFSWDQAKEMVDSGFISIQSHTHDLHYKIDTPWGRDAALTNLLENEDGSIETDEEHWERVYQDLHTSRDMILERTGNQPVSLSYPFGIYSEEVVEIARDLGFLLLFTIDPGVFRLEESVTTIPRINVPGGATGSDIEREIIRLSEWEQ